MFFTRLSDGPCNVVGIHAGPCSLARLRMTAAQSTLLSGLHPASCFSKWQTPSDDVIHLLTSINPCPERLDALWITLMRHNVNRPKEEMSNWDAEALDLAAGGGTAAPCISTCRLLLAFGANPNRMTSNNGTLPRSGGCPLMTSILHAGDSFSILLLEGNADPNLSINFCEEMGTDSFSAEQSRTRWSGPLEAATRRRSLTTVQALLKHGADVDQSSGWAVNEVQDDRTALLTACDYCFVEIFQELLAQGANPDVQCMDSATETGTRTVRDTLAWKMGGGDAGNFYAFGEPSGVAPVELEKMCDLLSAADERRSRPSSVYAMAAKNHEPGALKRLNVVMQFFLMTVGYQYVA